MMLSQTSTAIQLGDLYIQSQYARPAIVETAVPELHNPVLSTEQLQQIKTTVESIQALETREIAELKPIPVYTGKPAPAGWYEPGWCTFGAWKLAPWVGEWRDAKTWDEMARADGLTVDNNPVVGAVFVDNSGRYGHVGVVTNVSGDTVTIKEMNYTGFGEWSVRTLPSVSFIYIHPHAY